MKYPMNKEELMDWAAETYAEGNCEGTPEEALMAGWINAMDMQDATKLSDDEFINIAYSEFINMGYDK